MFNNLTRVGNTWVWPDGLTLPVIAGGEGPVPDPQTQAAFTQGVAESDANIITNPDGSVMTGVTPPSVPVSTLTVTATGANTNPGGTTATVPRTFTEDDLERVRKEEKDKLYGTIDTMREELKSLQAERDARAQAEEEARQQAEETARLAAEEEMTAKDLLATREREWTDQFTSLRQEMEQRDALLEQERRFTQLVSYRAQRIEQERENIAPQLIDLVSGNSEEEIDQSIASLKERTDAILRDISAAQASFRQQMPGSSVTAPPVGPLENQQSFEQLSPEDIRAMDATTYAQHRDRLLGAMRQNVSSAGIYGNRRG